jgi:hypothetical protein
MILIFKKNYLSSTASLYTKNALIQGKIRILIPLFYWLAQFFRYEKSADGLSNEHAEM